MPTRAMTEQGGARARTRVLGVLALVVAMTVATPFAPRASAAGPAVALTVAAPTTTTAGAAFSLTVTARDSAGAVATSYRGRVTFTSTDTRSPVLPPAYTFTAADNGRHTFAGVRLFTAGSRTVAAFDTAVATVKGRSAAVTVSPGTTTRLTLGGLPATARAGTSSTLTVTGRDAALVTRGHRARTDLGLGRARGRLHGRHRTQRQMDVDVGAEHLRPARRRHSRGPGGPRRGQPRLGRCRRRRQPCARPPGRRHALGLGAQRPRRPGNGGPHRLVHSGPGRTGHHLVRCRGTHRLLPVQVLPGRTVRTVTTGSDGFDSAAITSDGALWRWGGISDLEAPTLPVRVGTSTAWVAATVGNGHTMGLSSALLP